MNESGCKTCPAYAKCTATYRGSRCAALRDSYGLNDPLTNADRIRDMSDEELATFLSEWAERCLAWYGEYGETLAWLEQPVKEAHDETQP